MKNPLARILGNTTKEMVTLCLRALQEMNLIVENFDVTGGIIVKSMPGT